VLKATTYLTNLTKSVPSTYSVFAPQGAGTVAAKTFGQTMWTMEDVGVVLASSHDVETTVEKLRKEAEREFCYDSGHQRNLTCTCFHQFRANAPEGDVRVNGVATFKVLFDQLPKSSQHVIICKEILCSTQVDVSREPKHKKHLTFKTPMVVPHLCKRPLSILICKTALMKIVGKGKAWWDTAAASKTSTGATNGAAPSISSHLWPAWVSSEVQATKLAKMEKNRKGASNSTKKRKEIMERNALEAQLCGPAIPAIKYVQGNNMKREDCHQWNQLAKKKLEDSKHGEAYSPPAYTPGKGLKPHMYTSHQFYDGDLLPAGCEKIKALGDGDHGKYIKNCLTFKDSIAIGDMFLWEVSKECRNLLKDLPEFQGMVVVQLHPDEKKAWTEVIQAHPSVRNINEISEREPLQNPFMFALAAASYHRQVPGDMESITAYYTHKDKIGNVVLFLTLEGISYNLFAMPSKKLRPTPNEKAEFEEAGSLASYKEYKRSLSGDGERRMVEKFESEFLKEATDKHLPRVRVYMLEPGDRLMFAAATYLHGTIIPKNEQGTQRSLLVFHHLIPTT